MTPENQTRFEALQAAERKLGEFQAFLYDCDGTLVDSMLPHKEAWAHEIQKHAPQITTETIFALIDELAGMPGTKTIEVLNARYEIHLDPQELSHAKEKNFFENYLDRVTAIPHVVEDLKAHAAKGAKIGVVSGGRKRVVSRMLETVGIASLVNVIICAEDVKVGKPHPESFLMAAQKLDVPPSACLVLEDAQLGVEAAIAAGMKWIRIDQV